MGAYFSFERIINAMRASWVVVDAYKDGQDETGLTRYLVHHAKSCSSCRM